MTQDVPTRDATRDPFDELLGYHLRRASMRVMADLAGTLAPYDLRPTDASVLFVIAGQPGVTQSQIGRALAIKRANMVPIIAMLESRGIVEREPVDGRSQGLVLTPAGQALHDRAIATVRDHEERTFGAIDPAVRETLAAAMRVLWREEQCPLPSNSPST